MHLYDYTPDVLIMVPGVLTQDLFFTVDNHSRLSCRRLHYRSFPGLENW